MARPGVIEQWRLHFAVLQILAFYVHKNYVAEDHIYFGIALKKINHPHQRSRQILLIAIQVSDNFARRAAQAAVNRIVHSAIFFDECFDAIVF